MTFSEPYDLGVHLTEPFYNNIHSAKWSDRRDAIQELVDVLEKNPTLAPNEFELQKIISELSKILSKDNNINVAACSAQALSKIALGVPNLFRQFDSSVILICLTRMKDVKPVIKNACSECLDSVFTTTTFANVLEPIKSGLAITAPGSKIQTCEFFTRIMLKIDFPTAKNASAATKEVVDKLCKLASGSDPACRDASMRSLAAFMRAVTKQIAAPLLSDLAEDKLKMAKIDEYYEAFILEHPFNDGKKKVETSAIPASSNAQTAHPAPSETFATPYDLSKYLNANFYTNLHSAKWSERRDTIQELINIAEKNPVFVPNEPELLKLIGELLKIMASDSNINVVACVAQALSKLAYGAAEVFKQRAPAVILLCLTRMKEVKPVIKNACSECTDFAYSTTTFANVIGPIKDGLALTAPGSKIQTCEFFTRIMLKIDFSSVKQSITPIREVVGQLCKLALGSDSACRDVAMKALAALMRAISKPLAAPLIITVAADKLKMAKIDEYYEKFVADFPPNESSTGFNSSEAAKGDNPARPVTAVSTSSAIVKQLPSTANAAPLKKSVVSRGNTQPNMSVNVRRATTTTTTSRSTKPNVVKTTEQPKRLSIGSRGSTPVKSISKPVVKATPIAPNVVKIPLAEQKRIANQTNMPPIRTVGNVKPNLIGAGRPKPNIVQHNGNSTTYGLVRPQAIPDDDKAPLISNGDKDSAPRRLLLRPPSSVIRPTKSIDNLGHIH